LLRETFMPQVSFLTRVSRNVVYLAKRSDFDSDLPVSPTPSSGFRGLSLESDILSQLFLNLQDKSKKHLVGTFSLKGTVA